MLPLKRLRVQILYMIFIIFHKNKCSSNKFKKQLYNKIYNLILFLS